MFLIELVTNDASVLHCNISKVFDFLDSVEQFTVKVWLGVNYLASVCTLMLYY